MKDIKTNTKKAAGTKPAAPKKILDFQDYIDDNFLNLIDNYIEKNTKKRNKDGANRKTLRYGITSIGLNDALNYVKKHNIGNLSAKTLEIADKIDLKKVNQGKTRQIFLKDIEDLSDADYNAVTKDLLKIIAYKNAKKFDSQTDDKFKQLENHVKNILLIAAHQDPNRFLKNKDLMQYIVDNNKIGMASILTNSEHLDAPKSVREGLIKRDIMEATMLFNDGVYDEKLATSILEQIKKNPLLRQDVNDCFTNSANGMSRLCSERLKMSKNIPWNKQDVDYKNKTITESEEEPLPAPSVLAENNSLQNEIDNGKPINNNAKPQLKDNKGLLSSAFDFGKNMFGSIFGNNVDNIALNNNNNSKENSNGNENNDLQQSTNIIG